MKKIFDMGRKSGKTMVLNVENMLDIIKVDPLATDRLAGSGSVDPLQSIIEGIFIIGVLEERLGIYPATGIDPATGKVR